MRNSEQAVDKVLKGLREVEAPAGMEGRILLAMKQRAATPVPPTWQGLLRFVTIRASVAGGVALAGLLCVVLWMVKPPRLAKVEEVTAVHQVPVRTQATVSLPPLTKSQPLKKATLLRVSAISESDALAFDEMRAPSRLAPPLPPTEQERLLMRVALRHDPEQVAVLNPEMRAKQDLEAKLEFRNFFEPVRPAETNPSGTKTNDAKGETQ